MTARARSLLAVLFAAMLLASVAVATPAGASGSLPAAGRMQIDFEGDGGIMLDLPSEVAVAQDTFTLVPGPQTTMAYVLVSPSSCPLELPDWCTSFYGLLTQSVEFGPVVEGFVTSDRINAGTVEVYVLADGPVTLHVSIPELLGSAEVVAPYGVTGEMASLPNSCETVACDHIGYGGTTRERPVGSFAQSWATLSVRSEIAAGGVFIPNVPPSTAVRPCLYRAPLPTDPGAHPQGCDLDPAQEHGLQFAVGYAVNAAGGSHVEVAVVTIPGTDSLPVYAGYVGHAVGSTSQDVKVAGYGIWLEPNMTP